MLCVYMVGVFCFIYLRIYIDRGFIILNLDINIFEVIVIGKRGMEEVYKFLIELD